MAIRNRLPARRATFVRPMLTALAMVTGSMSAHALSLGRFQVLSSLGEPLRAEIEISLTSPEESQGLRAQIAPLRNFQQAGMEFNPALEGVSANIDQRNGRWFIVLQGRKPMQDTFVDLILETQWSTGRLVRNYALLLNLTPPKIPATPAPAAVVLPANPAPALPPSAPAERTETPEASSTVAAPAVAGTAAPLSAPALREPLPAASGRGITVAPGQTASQLALAQLPASVSLDQMLVAMLRHNPEAFIEDNVNLIRAGAQLQMPTREQALETPAQEARQIVIAQTRDFVAYSRRLAESPLQVVNGPNRETSGKVTTEVQTAPGPLDSQDILTLSKSQVGKSKAEVKVAAEREARETSEQTSELNKNIEELNSLIAAASRQSTDASGAGATGSMQEGLAGKPLWMWGAGLAALLGLLLWKRSRNSASDDSYAPSYDDIPYSAPSSAPSGGLPAAPADAPRIPPEMSSIDLNLPENPVPFAEPYAAPSQSGPSTDAAKLELAQLLLSKGDTDIARSLLQSVVAGDSSEHKAKALKLLGQTQ